ncbi:MAG TPA: hypothetical protein PLL64_02250 [Rhodothermales bacterium]|nr:hypothetical protein [Bacteroidota bacterium]HRK73068.1 hypothetical protein [Rhodothermales bacterium]HRR09851.1 hypothetical protein [Rhodothermales bacterium]
MSLAVRKILWANGIIWLTLAIVTFATAIGDNYDTAIAFIFLIIGPFLICLLLGFFMVFTSSVEERNSILFSELKARLLTLATSNTALTLS